MGCLGSSKSIFVDKFQMFGRSLGFSFGLQGFILMSFKGHPPKKHAAPPPVVCSFCDSLRRVKTSAKCTCKNTTSVSLKNIPYSTQKVTV